MNEDWWSGLIIGVFVGVVLASAGFASIGAIW